MSETEKPIEAVPTKIKTKKRGRGRAINKLLVKVQEAEPTPDTEEPPVEDNLSALYTETPDTEETAEQTDTPAVDTFEEMEVDTRPLLDKIQGLATKSDYRQINRALHVHRLGGTVAITKDGKLAFAPHRAPENGGKQALLRSGRVCVFVSDL